MAEQNLLQNRPFMAKQTFDQVSGMMWGQGALDYHTNYIVPRVHWDDSDIREEALYFAGLAQGLRVGASQKPNQSKMNQGSSKDRTSVPVGVNGGQMGSRDPVDLALFQAHVVHRPGTSYRPGIAARPRHHEHFHSDKPQQRVNTAAAKGADREIEKPSGVLSAPHGTTPIISITDGEASNVTTQTPASKPPVATRKENNIMGPLFENIPENSFDEHYQDDVHTPSTLEEEGDQAAYWEEMEKYFGGQGAGSDDVVSEMESGAYYY